MGDMEESLSLEAKPKGRGKGLSAFELKIIALICMTLDHIAAYGFEIPVIAEYTAFLRTVGRIAAPIFLFLLAGSISHTRSKAKFVLRLYLAGMCTGLFDTAVNFFFGKTLGYFTPGNIIFTFFYVALYALCAERLIAAIKEREHKAALLALGALALSTLPTVFFNLIQSGIPQTASTATRILLQGLRESLIPSFYDIDYGIGFVLLGLGMYFVGTKNRQCLVFAAFCLVCILGAFASGRYPALLSFSFFGFTGIFFDYFQCRMLLALALMLCYNSARGKSCKYVFYLYYPLHRQLLHVVFALLG